MNAFEVIQPSSQKAGGEATGGFRCDNAYFAAITPMTLGLRSSPVRERGFPGRLLRPTSSWVLEFRRISEVDGRSIEKCKGSVELAIDGE